LMAEASGETPLRSEKRPAGAKARSDLDVGRHG
jgi:hypothetical protein